MQPAFSAATYFARGAQRASRPRATFCPVELSDFPAARKLGRTAGSTGTGPFITVQEYEGDYGSDWNYQAITPDALA
jgi:hypothetical protein